ncbi:MAG: hypothetical protein SGARI_002739 [Bacillariaceae sp.]
MWRTENGERLGTFHGHKGTIWDLDVDRFSRWLLTASADATVKQWDLETGECLKTFPHRGPVRGIVWSEDNKQFATISDPFVEHNAKISIFDTTSDSTEPVLEIDIPKEHTKRVNATNIWWTYLNEHLLVSFDNGIIRLYNPVTGSIDDEIRAHDKKINRLQMNRDRTMFITSSADFSSKLYDAVNLEHLKTYTTDRPVNDAVISETKDHILLGGGQEAMSVTTTSVVVAVVVHRLRVYWTTDDIEFEYLHLSLFLFPSLFILISKQQQQQTVAINPNGLNYASGAEDGYVRLHFFDKSYLDMKDPVPEADESTDDDGEEDGKPKAQE